MKKLIATILSVFTVHVLFAQNMNSVESDLLKSFSRIQYWASDGRGQDYSLDSLLAANQNFEKMLFQVTSKQAASLNHPFKSLVDKGLHISSAPDGKFRIYTWNTLTGGSMHFYKNLFQFKSGNQVLAEKDKNEEGDPGVFFRTVNVVRVGNKDYYLGYQIALLSSALSYHSMKVFSIDDKSLNSDAKLIKTKTGIRNQLGYEVDQTKESNSDLPMEQTMIEYDSKHKVISLPLIQADGKVTDKRIKYQLKGRYFEKIG